MALFDKLRKALWQDFQAEGDRVRDAGDLALALQHYASAEARFDGNDDERAAMAERIETCRVRLRASFLHDAMRLGNARDWEGAEQRLRAAFDRSVTEDEKAEVEVRQKRLIRYEAKQAGDMGKWLATGKRPTLRPDRPTPVIHYVVNRQHTYTMERYLAGFGHPLQGLVSILPYDQLLVERQLASGTYIFADIERLNLHQRLLVADIWQQLEASDVEFRLLNHPLRSMRRVELLTMLHGDGTNDFTIYPIAELPRPLRRPVFLRLANDHGGSIGAGPYTEAQLDDAIARTVIAGFPVPELVAVEFCETVFPDGLYRKYAYARIGDALLPRHIQFGHEWQLKNNEVFDEEYLAEELRFTQEDPHRDQLWDIFERANIQYGRLDYSLKDGRIQVWEINTNPYVMAPPDYYRDEHLPNQHLFSVRALEAFEALAFGKYPRPTATINLSPERVQAVLEGSST